MTSWLSPKLGATQPPASISPGLDSRTSTAPTATKGISNAAATVAAAYLEKCKPAHEAAVHANHAVDGIKQALTQFMRQGDRHQAGLLDLTDLQPVELKTRTNSYRYMLMAPLM